MIGRVICLLLVVFMIVHSGCNADRVKPPEKVFEMYEDHEAAQYYSLPPAIANKVIPEEEKTHEVKQVLQEINHLKVLVLDNSEYGEQAYADVRQKLHSYVEEKQMKEMIHITHNGEAISINVREEDGELREVLVSIHGEKGFKGISMEGDLTMENIIRFVKTADFKKLESYLNPFSFIEKYQKPKNS